MSTITVGGQSGNFEINVMMPVDRLQPAAVDRRCWPTPSSNFVDQCVDGLTATERGPQMVERGLAICTALAPLIGYDAAAAIAKEAARTGGDDPRGRAREDRPLRRGAGPHPRSHGHDRAGQRLSERAVGSGQ